MRMHGQWLSAFLLMCWVLAGPVWAGAWGREPGEFWLSPKAYFYQATKYWDNNSSEQNLGATYDKKELNLYFEYGLPDRTLLVQTAWDNIQSGSDVVHALGDIELGFIQRLCADGPQIYSWKALLIVPTGYPTDRTPLISYGKYGVELGVLLGRSFEKGYLDTGLSYRYYDGYPSDQLRGNATFGYNVSEKIIAKGDLSAIYGLGNGQPIYINEKIVTSDYQILQADLSLVFQLDPNLLVEVGFNQALLGRNTGVGRSIYFGCDINNLSDKLFNEIR